jgi:hypothetical protein
MLIILFSLCCCNQSRKQTIRFIPVSENEFNSMADSSFAIPHGKIWDERKRVHDSCMGSSYAANAIFMRNRDTFLIGSIVDMKTMKTIKNFGHSDDPSSYFLSLFTVEAKPCYERRPLTIPIDSFLNHSFLFIIDCSNAKLNKELIEAVQNSRLTEIETGSWLNMELTDALGKILDTTTDESLLEYKKALLTPGNMILVRSSSITELSFYFHTQNLLPGDLKNKLLTKPVSFVQPYFSAQLFYIDDKSFELKLNGFFQIVGQFMKCELQ